MFSWNKPYVPQQRRSATKSITRQEHLRSYLKDPTLMPSTRIVNSLDDSTYDTVFATKSGHALIIRVDIGSGCPEMFLYGVQAKHTWVDSRRQNRIIGYSPIATAEQWSQSGILLGKAVNDVVKHLQLNPPEVSQIIEPALQAMNKRQSQQEKQSQHPQQQKHPPPPAYETAINGGNEEDTFDVPIPPIPKEFPELDSLTKEEMNVLLEDDDMFQACLKTKMSDIDDISKPIILATLESARENIAKEDEFIALHTEAQSLHKTLEEKINVFQTLEMQQKEIFEGPDKRLVIRKLMGAKKEIDEESENLASSWLSDGDMGVDEFIRTYIAKRTLYHTRNAKIERLRAGP